MTRKTWDRDRTIDAVRAVLEEHLWTRSDGVPIPWQVFGVSRFGRGGARFVGVRLRVASYQSRWRADLSREFLAGAGKSWVQAVVATAREGLQRLGIEPMAPRGLDP